MRQNEKGFTLLEVVIASMILTFGIVGYLAMLFQSINSRGYSQNMTKALVAENTIVEEMLTRDYAQLSGAGTEYCFKDAAREAGGEDAAAQDYDDGHAYALSYDIYDWGSLSSNPNSELVKIKTISMEVGWQQKGQGHTSRLVTFERFRNTVDEN